MHIFSALQGKFHVSAVNLGSYTNTNVAAFQGVAPPTETQLHSNSGIVDLPILDKNSVFLGPT